MAYYPPAGLPQGSVGAIPTQWRSGMYYSAGPVFASSTPGNGNLRLSPLYVPRASTLLAIGLGVTTVGSTGATVRLGIYNDDGTLYPGTLLLDAGTIDGTSATYQEISIASGAGIAVSPGIYWIGGSVEGAPATSPTVRGFSSLPMALGSTAAGASGDADFSTLLGYVQTAVTGALPGTFTTTPAGSLTGIRVVVKVQ